MAEDEGNLKNWEVSKYLQRPKNNKILISQKKVRPTRRKKFKIIPKRKSPPTTTTTTTTTTTSTTTTSTKSGFSFLGYSMPNIQLPWEDRQRPKRLTKNNDYIIYPNRYGRFDSYHSAPVHDSYLQPMSYYHHYQPTPMPYYHPPTTPAAQKSMVEVDFTPLFLAILPLFLSLG